MKRQEKNEIYSIRKFKVGVGSALIGLSFLGATGLVNDVPVIGDVFGVEHVSADSRADVDPTRFYDVKFYYEENIRNNDFSYPGRANLAQGPLGGIYSFGNIPGHYPTDFQEGDATLIKEPIPIYFANQSGESEVKKETVPFKTKYVKDDIRPVGSKDIVETDGVNGEVETRPVLTEGALVYKQVSYSIPRAKWYAVVDQKKWSEDAGKTETKTLKEVVNKVVKKAAKDKVVYSKKGNDVIKSTTVYTVNPDTGAITEKTTDEVFKANGAKDTVATTPIPSPKRYEKDATRERGQQNIETKGVEGVSSVTTTYDVNPQTGATTPTVGQPVVTKQPTETVIKVAAKDKVVTKDIPSPKRYEADNTKDFGSQNSETAGKVGKEVTTTVYTVDPNTGNVTEKSSTQKTEPTATVVKVGAKPTVTTKTDAQGRKVTETTTYVVDPNTGKVTPTTKTTYGEKEPTVEKKVVPSPIRYEKDTTRDKGAENITTKGKDGEDQIKTTYTVDPATGKVNQTVGQPVRTVQPTETVVKVAAKDKVEIVTRGDKKFKVTTTYDVDPKTGKISEKTSEVELPKETDAEDVDANKKLPDKVETIKPEVVYEKDATREKGTENITVQGKDGQKVTPVTKVKDPQTGKLVEKLGEPKITPATNTIVKVAAKDKVETKEIPSPKRYEADTTKDFGTPNAETKGNPGKEVVTTVYTVNPKTGEITEKSTSQKTDPTATVVKVGAKTKVEPFEKDGKPYERVTTYTVDPETGKVTPNVTEREVPANSKVEPIKPEVVYEKDGSREKGAENITVQGKDGQKVTPVTKVKDLQTGKEVEKLGEPIITPATNTIVKVAAKDKVVESEVPAKVRYVGDEAKDNGSEPTRKEGKPGKQVTTTVYTVNPKTGEITEATSTKRTEEPGETVVTIGTKPKVEPFEKDGKPYERVTTYTVDPETGKVTPNVTEREVGSKDKVEVIKPKKVYEKDGSREKGAENITVEGKDGKKVTPVYTVKDPATGKDVEKFGEPVITPATNTIVKVAAKDKVETIRKNGDTFERTTVYTVNPETGEITEEVTDKLIASNGDGLGIKPPVVENNDFNGDTNDKSDGNDSLKKADLGTGLNDFGHKKDAKKSDDIQFIPVNDTKPSTDGNNANNGNNNDGFKRSEKPVSQLPNTAGGNNVAINALGALTLTSVLGLAATKRKKEDN